MTITHRIRDERGQTMVEFALIVPIICLILFAVVQFGMLYNDYIALTDATRAGARKAAVSRHEASPAAAAEAAVRKSATDLNKPCGAAGLCVSVTTPAWEHGQDVTVEATYPYSIDLIGLPLASGRLKAKTTERVE
jgi:Flp pilus assembly protein TadG